MLLLAVMLAVFLSVFFFSLATSREIKTWADVTRTALTNCTAIPRRGHGAMRLAVTDRPAPPRPARSGRRLQAASRLQGFNAASSTGRQLDDDMEKN